MKKIRENRKCDTGKKKKRKTKTEEMERGNTKNKTK